MYHLIHFNMNTERKRGGRIPKLNPKSHHVMLRFDDDEWMKFLVMYEQTDVKAKAVFAKARIFGEPFKVLCEDKTLVEYYTKLSSFHSQYRMIGNNYNQVVKATVVLKDEYKSMAGPDLIKKLQDHVKHETAPYKYPRIIEFVDELPKTISGKIRRVEIREKDGVK